jgi:hypothetical protein
MARNNYFKVSYRESDLFEQLVVEQIKIYGFDVHYIFRKFQNLDDLFGEDPISKFEKSFQIEMFVSNYEFFESQNKIIDKFGINLQDSVTLMVAKKRFSEEAAKYGTDIIPQEGDIIYFPEYGGLYEIKYIGTRNSFFAYELSCELFRYSGEDLDTEIQEVDLIENNLLLPVTSFGITSGITFYEGELIYQGLTPGSSTYSGILLDIQGTTLDIRSQIGTPTSISPLRGACSDAEAYYTSSQETTRKYLNSSNDNTDTLELKRAVSDIIDFSERDPFSEGNY